MKEGREGDRVCGGGKHMMPKEGMKEKQKCFERKEEGKEEGKKVKRKEKM